MITHFGVDGLTPDRRRPITHNGVTYPSIAAFCRAFGLGQNAVMHRLRRGLTGDQLAAKDLRHPKMRKARER